MKKITTGVKPVKVNIIQPLPLLKISCSYLIQKKCTECQIEAILKTNGIFGNQYRVIYSDGYWIDISLDLGVIEIQAKPATREQYEMLAPTFSK